MRLVGFENKREILSFQKTHDTRHHSLEMMPVIGYPLN